MGGEKLWWTWGMQARSTYINESWLASTVLTWNDSALLNSTNSTGNDSCLEDLRINKFNDSHYDLLFTILLAVVLIFLILATIIGKLRK